MPDCVSTQQFTVLCETLCVFLCVRAHTCVFVCVCMCVAYVYMPKSVFQGDKLEELNGLTDTD